MGIEAATGDRLNEDTYRSMAGVRYRREKGQRDGGVWGGRHGCFEVLVQSDSSRKMSKKHVKMGGVVRADSAPAASATPRHQYIAPILMGRTVILEKEKASCQVPMELWLLWGPPWLFAIFVSESCR